MRKIYLLLILLLTQGISNAQTNTYCSIDGVDFYTLPIYEFNFNGLVNVTAQQTNAGSAYEDFTSMTTNVIKGNNYTFLIKGKTDGQPNVMSKVYIDLNHNFTFETEEIFEIGFLSDLPNEKGEVSATITIPNTALTGNTRMRVVNMYQNLSGTFTNSPCPQTWFLGQLEDYTINISEAQAPVLVESVQVTTQNNVPAQITTQNGTLQLVATINPINANQDVTFSIVSGSQLATVSTAGLVTAHANGTVTVRATSVADNTKFDDIEIVINHPVVIGVESVLVTPLNNAPAQITTENGTLQLNATINPVNANQEVVWSVVLGSQLATISNTGLLTALANGTVIVRATSVADNTKFDDIEITINYIVIIGVESVTVTTENNVAAQITTENGTLQLNATINPVNASQEVTWSIVSGSQLATISNDGLVTALANGTVTVRATSVADNTKFDDIEITINYIGVIGVESVLVTTENNVAAQITTENGTLQLNATINPVNASQEVTWSIVSGSQLATISNTGLVTALANGTVTVRATSAADNTKFDDIEIVIDAFLSNEDFEILDLKLYPNPATTILNIEVLSEIDHYTIFSMAGEKVLEGSSKIINLSDIASGIYFIKIQFDNNKTVVKRIVKA